MMPWRYPFRKPDASDLARKYGTTYEKMRSLLSATACPICGRPWTMRNGRVVDHDHKTGVVRAIICRQCNLGLGHFMDIPVVLRAAADYLEEHNLGPILR